MRREKKKSEAEKNQLWIKVIAAVYGVAAITFIVAVFLLDVLPITYFAALILLIAVIGCLLLKGLWTDKKKKMQIACAVLIGILALGMIGGTAMISGTLSFFSNIMGGNVQTYDYYAVVREDSAYEKLSDIKGETVFVLNVKDEVKNLAEQQLKEKVEVTFEKAENLEQLTNGLIDKTYNVIFLSSAYYDIVTDESEKFTKENTRILDTISVETEQSSDRDTKKLTKEPFNVYISGIDTTGAITNASRSDVNMVMTVNPTDRKILLTSIPRDYHVVLSSYGAYDKLTHSGIYGIEESRATVEDLLDMEIHHYVKVNFTTVTKLVDALGGITVDSEYAFTSRDGFQFSEGPNQVNGEQALSFARERKAFAGGDNQRVKNQQAVISGIINKVTGSSAILTQYSNLLGALSNNMETSMSKKDITSLVKMQLADMRGWDIEKVSLTGSGAAAEVYSMPGWSVYVMEPDQNSVEHAKEKINETMQSAESVDGEE